MGGRIVSVLSASSKFRVTAAVRHEYELAVSRVVCIGGLDGNTDWLDIVKNQKIVIHTAARAHVMKETMASPMEEYRRVNVVATLHLARQAAAAGVKRFIFISSIKVNGDQSPQGVPFTAVDKPEPVSAYGHSKWEAEQGLLKIAEETGMEIVVIRPPLVYGPGVKGNFARMINIVKRGLPLPLGAIHNARSMVGLDNLVDLILTCITHPNAANRTFLVSDGADLSTTDLLNSIYRVLNLSSRLIPIPAPVLYVVATLLGKKAAAQRLLGSLQVDITDTCELLDWKPPMSVEDGLRMCFEAGNRAVDHPLVASAPAESDL